MRSKITVIIFILTLICAAFPATAAPALSVDALKDSAAGTVVDFVKKKCPEYSKAEIKVSFQYSDTLFERLAGSGDKVSFEIIDEFSGYKPVGNVALPARVKHNGKRGEKVYLRARINVIQDVLVALRTLRRGDIISKEDIGFAKRDIANYRYRFFTDKTPVIGKQADSTVSKDAIIAHWMVKDPPVVARNAKVSIIVSIGNVQAEVRGVALEDGRVGEEIKVRNLSSRKELKAVVLDSGKVHVLAF